jgi:5-methylcytosine-specific restriction enzyme subunit McrC
VFEDFVRIALREDLGVTVGEFPSGGECPAVYLDAGGRVRLQPDVSCWRGNSCRFVGDVKYKRVNVPGVKHPDLYQLLAYTTATALSSGLLVYAAGEGEPATHDVILAGKRLHVRSLELAGDMLSVRTEIRSLATSILALEGSVAA